MTNVEIWEWMQRDLDGDLTPEERVALFALLEKDSDLQLKYKRLKNVSLQLEQLPPVVPSFSIVDSILPKLESAAATPAAKADLNEVVLPTLEVKRTSSQPSEPTKWKNKTVWLARIGSTAVAACLLIGVLLVGNEAMKQTNDPASHGSVNTPAAVETEPPALIGPPTPQPSTNPTPAPEVEGDQPAIEKTQPPKQQKTETPPKSVNKPPVPPPSQSQVQNPPLTPSVPAVKPVPREPKPPAFPYGGFEQTDDDDGKRDADKEKHQDSKVKDKESKPEGKENAGKKNDGDDDDQEQDHDHDDEGQEKKETKVRDGRKVAV